MQHLKFFLNEEKTTIQISLDLSFKISHYSQPKISVHAFRVRSSYKESFNKVRKGCSHSHVQKEATTPNTLYRKQNCSKFWREKLLQLIPFTVEKKTSQGSMRPVYRTQVLSTTSALFWIHQQLFCIGYMCYSHNNTDMIDQCSMYCTV